MKNIFLFWKKEVIGRFIYYFLVFVFGYVLSVIIVTNEFSDYISNEESINENKIIEIWPFVISVNYNEYHYGYDDIIVYKKVIRLKMGRWEICKTICQCTWSSDPIIEPAGVFTPSTDKELLQDEEHINYFWDHQLPNTYKRTY